MKYTHINARDYTKFLEAFLKDPHECWVNFFSEEPDIPIAVGKNNQIPGKLPENCFAIYDPHLGGVIVGFKDYINLVAVTTKQPPWRSDLVKYLKSRGLNAKIDENDVTVDGYKVAGFAKSDILTGKLGYYAAHITLNMDLRILQKICTKPIRKVPRGLSSWGITKREVLNALGVE